MDKIKLKHINIYQYEQTEGALFHLPKVKFHRN